MAAKTAQAKLDYIKEYDRENRLKIGVRLNKVHDAELIEVWQKIPNKADWLKSKLREEMEKQKAGK